MLSAVVIVAAVAAVYWNSFFGAMVLDDHTWILENDSIQHPASISELLFPLNGGVVGGRPVLSATLALNYALGGTDPKGYHLFNLCIHAAAALVLFGIVRRTLLLPALCSRFGSAATPLALAVALVWVVHPLQTAAVTYIIQRTESLMGLFYLLTLYGVIRGATAATSFGRLFWYAAAFGSCLLGMVTKEVMFTAPLVVLLYDSMFLAGSLGKALKERFLLYAGLAATWLCGLALLLVTGFHGGTTGFAVTTFTWQSYLFTQPGVILHYLQLAFWPAGLCLDYGWPPAEAWPLAKAIAQIAVPGAIVVALVGLAIVALIKRSPLGFLGATFFLILVPTSSFIPIKDAAFDYRMYLPLAALAALVVIGAYAVWDRVAPSAERSGDPQPAIRWIGPAVLLAAVAVALGWTTINRNKVFRSEDAIWHDVIAKHPDNWRAYASLGHAAAVAGDDSAAIDLYEQALQHKPDEPQVHLKLGDTLTAQGKIDKAIEQYGQTLKLLKLRPDSEIARYNLEIAHYSFGVALAKNGQFVEAIEQYRDAVRLNPDDARAHNNLADMLIARGQFDDAIKESEAALTIKPDYAGAHYNLATALAAKKRFKEAIPNFRQALEFDPRLTDAEYKLGIALGASGEFHEAVNYLEKNVARHPNDVAANFDLGSLYDKDGQTDKAVAQYEKTLDLSPDHRAARINLGAILDQRGNLDAALDQFNKALAIDGEDARLQNKVAGLYGRQGNLREAIVHYQSALEVEPRNATTQYELAGCFRARGQLDDAIEHYRRAVEIKPDYSAAQNNLAAMLAQRGKLDEALPHFEKAVELDPKHADAHYNLGMILISQGKTAEAVGQWRTAVRLKPDEMAYLRPLALVLATDADASVRNGAEAVALAERGVELPGGREPNLLGTLAAAYAETGQFARAVATAGQAVELALDQRNSALADQLTDRLKLYRAGKPYREKQHAPAPSAKQS